MPDKRILIIDADDASRNYLMNLLKGQQYHVQGVDSGKNGLIFTWRDRPDLIIFDPEMVDILAEEFLLKLQRDPRSAGMPIIVLSRDPDPNKKEAFLQAGCSEYLVKSGEAVAELPGLIQNLLNAKSTFQEPEEIKSVTESVSEPVEDEEKDGGYLIVFLSAKGGTGTSSLCANLAMTIHHNQPEARIVVVDMVLPIGSIAPIVGYEGDVNLISVADLSSDEVTKEYLHKNLPNIGTWEFKLLAGATDPEQANKLQVKNIPDIIKKLQATYDYVVIDLGRALSRISLPIIKKADLLALAVSTDQSTITLTKTVWDYLHEQGISVNNTFAILNRAVGLEGLTKTEAEEILELPIKATVPYMRGNFALANNLNQPIILKYPNDTATIVIKDTASNMVNMLKTLRN